MWQRLPFLLHALVETPAAFTFVFTPQRQLPNASNEAELLLASYGGALLTTVGISAFFLLRTDFDDLSRVVGLILSVYHLFPLRRAVRRIAEGSGTGRSSAGGSTLGGSWVHLTVHIACFSSLLGLWLVAPAS